MNKSKLQILYLLLFLCSQQSIIAQSIQSPANQELSTNHLPEINNQFDTEDESVLRRVEIIFLVSLPFTTLMSILLFNSVYYISDTNYNFTMSKLPHEILPFTFFSAAFTSGIITYADYRSVQSQKNKISHLPETDADNTRELQLGVGIQKKF